MRMILVNKPFAISLMIAGLATLLLVSATFAQSTTPAQSPTSTLAALVQTFQQEQAALGQQEANLAAEGATPAQLNAWEDQHAALFQAQAVRAQQISASTAGQPLTYLTTLSLGDNVSSQQETLMTSLADLLNDFTQIHNQEFQNWQLTFSLADTVDMEDDVADSFDEQDAAKLAALSAQIDAVNQLTEHQAINLPSPPAIPPGASPQLSAYLTACYQIEVAEIQMRNQNCAGTAAQLETARQQWEQQNNALLLQVSHLGQSINTTTQN